MNVRTSIEFTDLYDDLNSMPVGSKSTYTVVTIRNFNFTCA